MLQRLCLCVPVRQSRTIVVRAEASRAEPSREETLAALGSRKLVHHTTVALIPPDDAWDPIQEARALVRDRGLWRWPPHANLLYPFHEPAEFDLAAPILSHALASVQPFELELREFDIFEHSSRSATLWVRPDPSREGALQELHSALESALPHCNHQTADHGGRFTPHFTIGHFGGRGPAEAAKAQILESGWPGVSFRVAYVCMMARDGPEAQLSPRYWIPLGGGAPVAADDDGFPRMPSERPEFCAVRPPRSRRRGKRKPRPRNHANGESRAETSPTDDENAST